MSQVAIRTQNKTCQQFGVCGGCSFLDADYSDQLAKKENLVRGMLTDFPVQTFHSIKPSPDIYFYRNKMEFSFGDHRDLELVQKSREDQTPIKAKPFSPVHVGLHPKRRYSLVMPAHDCLLQSKESQEILKTVSDWADQYKVQIYTRHNHEGILKHLVIREGKNTGQRMVNLFSRSSLHHLEELADALKQLGTVTTFIWTSYDDISDVASAPPTKILWGEGRIQEKVGTQVISVPPNSFMQTNTHASEEMIRLLKDWSRDDESWQTVIDLYCGAGTIGLNLAENFEYLVGVESNEEALAEARHNAELNKITHYRFMASRVEKVIKEVKKSAQLKVSTVVVDPPRMGLHVDVAHMLLEMETPSIYYVSCNPKSLSRDLKILTSKYSILDAQPMDFFPHTDHVETAVRLHLK